MGNTDSTPVISQLKSLVQATSGDKEAALITQEHFIRGCPVISQFTSAVQWTKGHSLEARETQYYFLKCMSALIDSLPVIGHTKAIIQFYYGDAEGGKSALLSATRTVSVIAGGISGGILFGLAGAITGGVTGGATADGIYTLIESKFKGAFFAHGYFYYLSQIHKGGLNAGSAFDFAMLPIFDGIAGGAYVEMYKTMGAGRTATAITAETSMRVAFFSQPQGLVTDFSNSEDIEDQETSSNHSNEISGQELLDTFEAIDIDRQ